MASLRRFHREMGELGHLGEFFFALGLFIFIGGFAILAWGWWWGAGPDSATSGWLFVVAGAGVMTFAATTVFSGWGRHHPKFESGGDPDVDDSYDAEGR